MRWRDLFTGTDFGFHQILEEQLKVAETMVETVARYLDAPTDDLRQQLADEAGETEHRGDALRRDLTERLSQTFVTPFDREDVNELSRAIDDICDYAENTIKEIRLYRVDPDIFIRAMVQTLLEAVRALKEAVEALSQDTQSSNQAALRAKSMENKMEGLYRKAIADFSAETEVHYLIKMREVYRHLSNAADRVDLAANVINSIVVKQNL